jgi:hypothetical protein
MNTVEEPDDHEHVGDKYVTYNRRRGRRDMPNFPPFPHSSEEEEEAHKEEARQREEQNARPSVKQRGG